MACASEATATLPPPEDVWLLMGGRSTTAGRFLHRLYAGGAAAIARRKGDAYSAANRPSTLPPSAKPKSTSKSSSSKAASLPSSSPQQKARLPHSGSLGVVDPASATSTALRQEALAAQRRLAMLGAGRRSAAAILLASARSAADAADAQPPMPRRRLLGEAEKARCALLMEHRGVVPAAENAGAATHDPSSSSSSSSWRAGAMRGRGRRPPLPEEGEEEEDEAGDQEVARRRFAELREEVAERERFLEAMRSAGALRREHVEVVRAQVADRVAEMRRLHARLSLFGGSS